jgi:predicted phosphodiesterase
LVYVDCVLRLRILSDLHFEFHRDGGVGFVNSLDPKGVDVLVLAGDITKMRVGFYRTLKTFRDRFPEADIIWVHGNHEYHESSRTEVVRTSRDAVSHLQGVHWLDSGMVEVRGHRILGTPLWFPRGPAPKHPFLLSTDAEWHKGIIRSVSEKGVVRSVFADFEAISDFDTWVYAENARATKFLADNLREGDILVTHYVPTRESTSPRFRDSLSNCWFIHDLTELLLERRPALVIHGHTHTSFDYRLGGDGGPRVVCNPMGYVTKGEVNRPFRDDLTVTLL